MRESLKKFAALLSADARGELRSLCVLAAATGLLETASVLSIMPFLAALANPDVAAADPRVAAFVGTFGIESSSGTLAAVGALVLALLIAGNAAAAFTTLRILGFANRRGHELAVRLLGIYLRQPYTFILHRHTAELQKNILVEVNRITVGTLAPAVQMLAKSFVALFLLVLLLAVDPVLALTVGLVLGGCYFAVFRGVRSMLQAAGRESLEAGTQRALHAQEALSAFKDIKLLAREEGFVGRYAAMSLRWANALTKSQALSALPRYAVEVLAFAFVLAVVIYLLATKGEGASALLPTLGLYAFAGYRLLPAVEQIFSGWATLRFSRAALDIVLQDLALEGSAPPAGLPGPAAGIAFEREVVLAGIGYRYRDAADWAVRGVTLRIARNSSVALVGPTGCGKTTVIDLLMGLLPLAEGSIAVDGTVIEPRMLVAWQRLIGHVPQQIFLCDDTVARNIAFGLPNAQVDMAQVERAARLARLHGFVAALPRGYSTVVGERGIRLSGGERQRIGIARALYQDPELLVLDEATSALDSVTENAVLEALQELAGRKTIVMVAHRLSTVRACDVICVMDRGRIAAQGRYDELIRSSEQFRALAAAG